MRKLLNKPWFVVMIAVAAIALVANSVLPSGDNTNAGLFGGPDADADAAVVSVVAARAPTDVILKALPTSSVMRDPFALRPIRIEAVEKQLEPDAVDTLHLSALWTQEGQTLALLNDRICQGGDELGRFKIESATSEGVWITHWKGRDFLSIGGYLTLNTPANHSLSAINSL